MAKLPSGKQANKRCQSVHSSPNQYDLPLDPPSLTLGHRDQELRFVVHDSPDYYQLKVSVFNDDKKTELIGETWIDLRDIIIPGGGQNDLWQNLACKGKYAGEIRIEITFYDSRPKPEKPAAKPKPVHSDGDSFPGQHQVPKRRPLPSDPYTGQAPAQPLQPAPSHIPTPPRPQPSAPKDHPVEYSTLEHTQTPPRGRQPNPTASFPTHPIPSGQYGSGRSHRHRQAEQHPSAPSSAYHTPPPRVETSRGPMDRDRYSAYPEDASFSPDHQGHTPDKRYVSAAPYAAPPLESGYREELVDDRPPPPPVHRTTPSASIPEPKFNSGREMVQQNQTPPTMRRDVLRNEAHRQSVPASTYPGRPVYRAHDSVPTLSSGHELTHGASQQFAAPRHHSYDAAYDAHHRSLQPTVEDVPDSPGSGVDEFRRSWSRASPYGEADHRQNPSPAPLNLSGRNSAADMQQYGLQRQDPSPDYMQAELFLPSNDYTATNAQQPSYDVYSQSSYAPYRQHIDPDHSQVVARVPESSKRYEMPAVPAPLIPGVDPALSMEISQRLNEDRRHERRHTQPAPQIPAVGSMRGREMIEPPPSYSVPPPETSQTFNPPQHAYDNYDRGGVAYHAGQSHHPSIRDHSPGHSPSGRHTIKRKSVSPAPPPPDSRRLSGVPFGPDSYDALNPSLSTPLPKEQARQEKEYDEIGGKIITHDGKEIDPSDHLPMDTWAPEPEPKGKKPSGTATSRPSLSGPQPIPSSGRKPLRIREARPSSITALPPAMYITPEVTSTPLPPPITGRNRLQKKAHRSSATPVMMSGANGPGPTPLAPLAQPQDRDSFAPRPLGRASTVDYENHAPPMYDTSSAMPLHGGRDHSASAPPIPAKIPLNAGGAMVPLGRAEYGGDMTLMEEMSKIDIGTGRARRHAQRSTIGGY